LEGLLINMMQNEPSLAKAGNGSLLLAWLEEALLAERKVVDAALSERHAALLKNLIPQIHEFQALAVERPPQDASRELETRVQKNCSEGSSALCSTPGCLEEELLNMAVHPLAPHVHGDSGENGQSTKCTVSNGNRSNGMNRQMIPNQWVVSVPAAATRAGSSEETPASLNDGINKRKSQLMVLIRGDAVPEDNDMGQGGSWSRIHRFVTGPHFELGFAGLILLNTAVMAAESQYEGIDTGFRLGYPSSRAPADETWRGGKSVFMGLEFFFGTVFTIELLLKILCFRVQFFRECWNLIDTVIVLAWVVSTFGSASLPFDLLLLRLLRLARLMRLLRLVRTIQMLDSLYLMTTAMRGSVYILFWAVILLAAVQTVIALFLQAMLADYILDESKPEERRMEVYMFYGTFARTMLTMFEITLGNWMPPCRALVENVSEWYMLFSLTHKLVIGFSVVTVMTAVFIQETFKVASQDDRIAMMTKERARKSHIRKIGALFDHLDKDGDGMIRLEQFKQVLGDDEVKLWLASMEIDVRSEEELFILIDRDLDGHITVHELVEGMFRLRGAARNYDLAGLEKGQRRLEEQVQALTASFCIPTSPNIGG